MPSEGDRQALLDILENIQLARQFTADMLLVAFESDVQKLYATTRCLEIISEASRRLPAVMKERHSDVPWPIIAGTGNVYRHDYKAVRAERIWYTVHSELTALEGAVRQEIDALQTPSE